MPAELGLLTESSNSPRHSPRFFVYVSHVPNTKSVLHKKHAALRESLSTKCFYFYNIHINYKTPCYYFLFETKKRDQLGFPIHWSQNNFTLAQFRNKPCYCWVHYCTQQRHQNHHRSYRLLQPLCYMNNS